MDYPNTISALKVLQNSLSCTKCHTLRSTLCTLGGCEHLFCRECCSSLVGTSCPECQIPVHVKDAHVNKQLSNLVSLCQELGRILVSGSHGDDREDRPINNATDIGDSLGVLNCHQTTTAKTDVKKGFEKASTKETKSKENKNKKPVSRATRLRQSLEDETGEDGGVGDLELDADDTNMEMEETMPKEGKEEISVQTKANNKRLRKEATGRSRKSVKASEFTEKEDKSEIFNKNKGDNSARRGRSRSRSNTNQVSKLQNCASNGEEDSREEETPVKKGRKLKTVEKRISSGRSSKRTNKSEKAADQSTMTRFYDCSDEEIISDCPDEEENTTMQSGRGQRNRDGSRQRENYSGKSRKKETEKPVDQKTMTQFYDYEDEEEMPLLEMPDDTKNEPEKLTVVKKRSGKTQRNKSREASQKTTEKGASQRAKKKGKGSVKTSPVFRSSPVKRGRRSLTGSQGDPPVKRNALGETPLQVAAIKGDLERVKALLEAGAKPNVRDNAGWTPLHESCNHGFTSIVELLLDNGALINVPGPENDTPLHDAVSNYRLDVVKLLVSRGAAVNARNIHGRTPKDLATTEQMRQILESGGAEQMDTADIMEIDEDEYIPLCFLRTALPRDDGRKLQKCASVLQAKLVDAFSADVSHVVTSTNNQGQCPRTLKYLHAVLAGKWVVSLEWVDMCLEYKQKVCEEAFEVPGSSTNPDTHAAMKGRLNRRQQLPGLFDGCQFYFHGTFQNPEKEELQSLVKDGGGTLLSREPKIHNLDDYTHTVPYHATSTSKLKDCGLYIIHDKTLAYPSINSTRLCSVPSTWIMECIATFSLVDP